MIKFDNYSIRHYIVNDTIKMLNRKERSQKELENMIQQSLDETARQLKKMHSTEKRTVSQRTSRMDPDDTRKLDRLEKNCDNLSRMSMKILGSVEALQSLAMKRHPVRPRGLRTKSIPAARRSTQSSRSRKLIRKSTISEGNAHHSDDDNVFS